MIGKWWRSDHPLFHAVVDDDRPAEDRPFVDDLHRHNWQIVQKEFVRMNDPAAPMVRITAVCVECEKYKPFTAERLA